MKIDQWKKLLKENKFVLEADDEPRDNDERDADAEKDKVDREKAQAASNQAADKADQEEKPEEKPEAPAKAPGQEKEKGPNISFNRSGEFYKKAFPQLDYLTLTTGQSPSEDEKDYISLSVQSTGGRLDGLEKTLRNGKAGNIRGSDFPDDDIARIMDFLKRKELVR